MDGREEGGLRARGSVRSDRLGVGVQKLSGSVVYVSVYVNVRLCPLPHTVCCYAEPSRGRGPEKRKEGQWVKGCADSVTPLTSQSPSSSYSSSYS